MVGGNIRDLEDLFSFEIPQVNPGHAAVGVVIDKQPAPIVFTIGFRKARMVTVTPAIAAQHLPAFVIEPIPGARVRCKYRNRANVTHRRNSRYEDLATVPT